MKTLKTLSASIAMMNMKLNQAHFNYEGREFLDIHELSEELYKALLTNYDDISEKIRMGGEFVPATLQESLTLSIITEKPWVKSTLEEVTTSITEDLKTLIDFTNKGTYTPAQQPIVDELYITLDKYRWLFASMA